MRSSIHCGGHDWISPKHTHIPSPPSTVASPSSYHALHRFISPNVLEYILQPNHSPCVIHPPTQVLPHSHKHNKEFNIEIPSSNGIMGIQYMNKTPLVSLCPCGAVYPIESIENITFCHNLSKRKRTKKWSSNSATSIGKLIYFTTPIHNSSTILFDFLVLLLGRIRSTILLLSFFINSTMTTFHP